MHKSIDETPTFFQIEKAESLAEELNNAGDDWSYIVVHPPIENGFCRIKVLDENGDFVAYF